MSEKRHYVLMDFIRFFCAVYVVLLHLVGSMLVPEHRLYKGEIEAYSDFYSTVNSFVYYGWVGVPIFFTISGFVIAISAERSVSSRQFIIDRLLRIYPALWICTILSLLAYLSLYNGGSVFEVLMRFLRSMTLFPMGGYLDGVVWTIVVELVFYFYCFLVLLFKGKGGLNIIAYYLLLGSSFYWVYASGFIFEDGDPRVGQIARRLVFEHGSFFAVGIFLSQCKNIETTLRLLPLLLIGMGVSYFPISSSVCHIYKIYEAYGASSSVFFPYFVWVVACFMIPMYGVFKSQRLASVARNIGLMTYPLYLIHSLLGRKIYIELSSLAGVSVICRLLVTFGVLILIAYMVSSKLEPLLREWVKNTRWVSMLSGGKR